MSNPQGKESMFQMICSAFELLVWIQILQQRPRMFLHYSEEKQTLEISNRRKQREKCFKIFLNSCKLSKQPYLVTLHVLVEASCHFL